MNERVAVVLVKARDILPGGREIRDTRSEVKSLAREIFGDRPRINFSVPAPIILGSQEMARQYGAYGVGSSIRISGISGYLSPDPESNSFYASLDVAFLHGHLSIALSNALNRAEYAQSGELSHRDRLNELSRLKVIREVLGSVVQLKKDGLLEEVAERIEIDGRVISTEPFESSPASIPHNNDAVSENPSLPWGPVESDQTAGSVIAEAPFITPPVVVPADKLR